MHNHDSADRTHALCSAVGGWDETKERAESKSSVGELKRGSIVVVVFTVRLVVIVSEESNGSIWMARWLDGWPVPFLSRFDRSEIIVRDPAVGFVAVAAEW